jgi:hypothetical protein
MNKVRARSSFHIRDRVSLDFGRCKLIGEIVEDCGGLGVGGRRLFRVSIPMDPLDPMVVVVPEDEIESAPSVTNAPVIDGHKIVDYLVNGGLVAILRRYNGGEKQPKVWLCLDTLGNVTHTFVAERGIVGGEIIPFWVLHDDNSKIFTAHRGEVEAFLKSFDLSLDEAKKIIEAVGLAP